MQSACWQLHHCCYLTAAAGVALLPAAVDLVAGAAALHLHAAAAVIPAAARRLVLVKGPAVLKHLEEAGGIGLQFDAVICVTAAHDLADHVMPGLAAAAAAAAAAGPELHLLQLFLAPCDAHLQSDAVA